MTQAPTPTPVAAASRAESASPIPMKAGSEQVQAFYDTVGWRVGEKGVADDTERFGVREDGPIRQELHRQRIQRIREAIAPHGRPVNLLECGCGGNPATALLDLCGSYTGVDFSSTGLGLAQARMSGSGIDHRFLQADLSALPFDDGSFDAVYSAHAIYHIPSAEGQSRAFAEALRVLRPGGRAVFVLSNPRPLLFPLRFARRFVADMPILSGLMNRIRKRPPLPYKAMPLGWMRRRLERHGRVRIIGYAMASTWFNQRVSERGGLGAWAWRRLRAIETGYPRLAAYLGNYVTIIVSK